MHLNISTDLIPTNRAENYESAVHHTNHARIKSWPASAASLGKQLAQIMPYVRQDLGPDCLIL